MCKNFKVFFYLSFYNDQNTNKNDYKRQKKIGHKKCFCLYTDLHKK